jgi:hypothetical protein
LTKRCHPIVYLTDAPQRNVQRAISLSQGAAKSAAFFDELNDYQIPRYRGIAFELRIYTGPGR